ncbi:MAG: hypothetical protein Q8Q60_05125 [Candidatus Chromulinivorax sp.]|nr:hypothetical protein [Candidatus Chromulinivorax sp.]
MWFINGRSRVAQMQAEVEIAQQNRLAQQFKLETERLTLEGVHALAAAQRDRQ